MRQRQRQHEPWVLNQRVQNTLAAALEAQHNARQAQLVLETQERAAAAEKRADAADERADIAEEKACIAGAIAGWHGRQAVAARAEADSRVGAEIERDSAVLALKQAERRMRAYKVPLQQPPPGRAGAASYELAGAQPGERGGERVRVERVRVERVRHGLRELSLIHI